MALPAELQALHLFAGVGGGCLGLELVTRVRPVAYVERDPYAAATLVARMEDQTLRPAPIWDDVSTFDGRPFAGRVALIDGGFPCQDISIAGTGKGLDGERSGLWSEYARIVREVAPGYVFVENSPALTSRGLDRVLGDLAELGFDAEWDVFSAGGVGAPHGRRRLYLLAERVSHAFGDPIWIQPERGTGAPRPADPRHAEPRHLGVPMADTARCGSAGKCGSGEARVAERGGEVADRRSERLEGQLPAGAAPRAARRGGGAPMGDADRGRCEGERIPQYAGLDRASWDEPHRPDPYRGFRWPPGPDDGVGWRDYVAAGGPLPILRRGSHGVAYRVDRLRCTGNGIVPAVAARAFLELWYRLRGGRL